MALSSLAFRENNDRRSAELRRIKAITTVLLGCCVLVAVLARLAAPHHWSCAYIAAWAEAAAVGGLADWYAVVALFRHPCGVPLPYTSIIPSNQTRIADNFGAFVQDQLLTSDAAGEKLRSVDFASLGAEWLADERRSIALSRFALRLLPQALSAIEETGLRALIAASVEERLRALEPAPLAAKLMSALIEDHRRQRVFDEVLTGLNRILNNEETLAAIREKVRREQPTMFNLFRADAYLVRRFVRLMSAAIEEANDDPDHTFRRGFDRFAREFVDKLNKSPEYATRAEKLRQTFLDRFEAVEFADDLWRSMTTFLRNDARDAGPVLERHAARFLADLGRRLLDESEIRGGLNAGVVSVLQTIIETNKREVARFITEQIKSWNVERMLHIAELNIGRDLQFIRLNGTFVDGLAGLCLYAGEQAMRLR